MLGDVRLKDELMFGAIRGMFIYLFFFFKSKLLYCIVGIDQCFFFIPLKVDKNLELVSKSFNVGNSNVRKIYLLKRISLYF